MASPKTFALGALALVLGACRSGGVNIEPVAASVQRPSNVAFYVHVTQSDEPVTGLTVSDFVVSEDGRALDRGQVQLTLLARDGVVAHRTVLLVDETGPNGDEVSKAAASFVRSLRATQPVSVYAYGGMGDIRPVGEFPVEANAAEPRALEGLSKKSEGSRDLHGAVVKGIERLDAELAKASEPVKVGTLVVFVQGPDLAGRVAAAQMDAELARSQHAVLAVGASGIKSQLGRIGRSGVYESQPGTLQTAFSTVAARVTAERGGHYLLSYCSPSRFGRRDVHVEVSVPTAEGRNRVASFGARFDATGFSAGCDAKAPPRFLVTLLLDRHGAVAGAAPEPVEEETEEDEEAEGAEKVVLDEDEGEPDKKPAAAEPPKPPKRPARAPRPAAAKPRPAPAEPPPPKPAPPAPKPPPPAGDDFEP
jgi:hypothetical protein